MPGVCSRCLREVYFAEEKLALGKVWHNFCFSCRNCRKLLDSWTVATHSGELYCRNCHNRLFPTKSVRPPLPSIGSPIFPPVGTTVSPCESLTDCCCCCCYCNDECDFIDPRSGDENLSGSSDSPEAKQRLRGGGDEDEELEANLPLEAGGTKQNSDNEDSQLDDAQSFVTTLCDPPLTPTAVTTWHNKHNSASQSTFSRPSSPQRSTIRPSSTPVAGETAVAREATTCHYLDNRKPGSPCRTNHKHHGCSKRCQHHLCRDIQRADKIVGFQERGKFGKDYRGGHFVANYRNLLRLELNNDLGVPSPFTKGFPSFTIHSHHKIRNRHLSANNLTAIDPLRRKSTYPPLPPHYSAPCRRRISVESAIEFFSKNQVASSAMQKIVDPERTDVDIITLEHSPNQEQPNISEGHFSSFPTQNILNIDDPEDDESYEAECRLRGGCGGSGGGSGCCCSSGPRKTNVTFDRQIASPCNKGYESDRSSTVDGACGCSGNRGRSECGAIGGGCCNSEREYGGHSPRIVGFASKFGSERRSTGFDACPPHPPDPCCPDTTNLSPCSERSFSSPCSSRKGCCPPAGCRPVRRRIARCNTPCMGDMQSCGGGGCCGGGCRGGCGKPGQTCLPLKPCTIPPCKPLPRCGGSPCVAPRGCSPQPPYWRSPVLPGTPGSMSGSGGSSCYRSGSPGGRSCGGGGCSPNQGCQQQDDGFRIGCQPKLPSGCECLGGGQDCQRCGRKVYQAEMQIASGVPYHNICFSCFCCRKPLETLTYHENCGEIYCKQCYVRNFGPQGYGYAGVLQTPM